MAIAVYRRQKREALQTQAELPAQIAQQQALLTLTAATTLMTAGTAARLERNVEILQQQVASAFDDQSASGIAQKRPVVIA